MVRAKFKVDSVTEFPDVSSIVLSVVTAGAGEENKKFFKWTPGGKIEMGVVSKETAARFRPGREYFVDFTPIEEA
ncbi:MAG: hypothetical protein KKB59_10515 [Spirochaetes bacterium]|nr:hypothetical protein [Spirochaetota bacterium]